MDSMEQHAPCMDSELLDRIIVARLIESPPTGYPQAPLHYLLGCYARSSEEQRSRAVLEDPKLLATVASCKELIVSYAMLCLHGVVPQVTSKRMFQHGLLAWWPTRAPTAMLENQT